MTGDREGLRLGTRSRCRQLSNIIPTRRLPGSDPGSSGLSTTPKSSPLRTEVVMTKEVNCGTRSEVLDTLCTRVFVGKVEHKPTYRFWVRLLGFKVQMITCTEIFVKLHYMYFFCLVWYSPNGLLKGVCLMWILYSDFSSFLLIESSSGVQGT